MNFIFYNRQCLNHRSAHTVKITQIV